MHDFKEQLAAVKEQMEPERLEGEVTTLLDGFGFLRYRPRDSGRVDYFFHRKNLVGTKFHELEVGDLVSFIPEQDGERGMKAADVMLETQRHLRKRWGNANKNMEAKSK